MNQLITVLIVVFLVSVSAHGQVLLPNSEIRSTKDSAAEYSFPYKDSYVSTAIFAIMRCAQYQPKSPAITVHERNHLPLLEGRAQIDYSYLAHKGPAPLVVIVPGLGGLPFDGGTEYMQEFFFKHGYHALAVTSPFNWKFALSSSRSGLPGVTHEDAEDLNSVLRRVLPHVQRRASLHYTDLYLVGYSLGALQAAYMARIDSQTHEFNWKKVLLVNPPIDLPYALGSVDYMFEAADSWTPEQRSYAWSQAGGALIRFMSTYDPEDPDYFFGLMEKLSVHRSSVIYAMGRRFRETLTDTLFVVHQRTGLGAMPYSNPFDRRRLTWGRKYSYRDYFEHFVAPYWQRRYGTPMHLNAMNGRGGLEALKPYLHTAHHVHLFHNENDILIRKSDLLEMAAVFGDRAHIYPLGGHMGNLWFKQNQQDLIRVLQTR